MEDVKQIIARHGGQVAVAQKLGISQQAVSKWVKRGSIPSHRLVELGEAA